MSRAATAFGLASCESVGADTQKNASEGHCLSVQFRLLRCILQGYPTHLTRCIGGGVYFPAPNPIANKAGNEEAEMINGHDVRPAKWSDVIDLYDDGEYSAIWGRYENDAQRELGVRWNGYDDSKGFPLSSGHPVWHVEPYYLARGILPVLLERTLSVPQSGGNKDNILIAMSELAQRYESNGIHLAVALYAASNRGKTTTLKMLIELLKADILRCNDGKSDEEKNMDNRTVIEKPYWDGATDILFCCKYNGRTIGVATGGDYDDAQKIAFKFFNNHNCDMVFCATRSRSDSCSWRAFAERTYTRNVRVICIRKKETDVVADQAVINASQANELMALIETNGIA